MAPTNLERPDEHEAGAADEVYCWINHERECGADCPAFDARSLRDTAINPCIVLNNIRALTSVASRLVGATLARQQISPPPPVVPSGG